MLAMLLTGLEREEDRQLVVSLYLEYHDRMLRAAQRIVRNPADAEDAAQNAFVQIIRNLEKIFQISCEKLPAYCISIVRNEALQLLRQREQTLTLEEWDGALPPAPVRYRELVELIQQMPALYRSVLELKLLSGCTEREIAQELGLSETAVASRAARGRKLLQKLLREEGIVP